MKDNGYRTVQIPSDAFEVLRSYCDRKNKFMAEVVSDLICDATGHKRSWSKHRDKSMKNLAKVVRKYSPSKSANMFLLLVQETYGIEIEREYQLEGRFFDGKYKTVLFEIDGHYWHSTRKQRKIDNEKDAIARRNGFLLIRVTVNSVQEAKQRLDENKIILDILPDIA